MHKTDRKLMLENIFRNFWLRMPYEDKEVENKTQKIRQLGPKRLLLHSPTRRSPLPFGPGGGLPAPLGGHRRPPAIFRQARLACCGRASQEGIFGVAEAC